MFANVFYICSFHSSWKYNYISINNPRTIRGDKIEVFKILNGYENTDRNIFFSLKTDSRTRGHEATLVKDQCRLDLRKYSFSQRTVNEWKKLSV